MGYIEKYFSVLLIIVVRRALSPFSDHTMRKLVRYLYATVLEHRGELLSGCFDRLPDALIICLFNPCDLADGQPFLPEHTEAPLLRFGQRSQSGQYFLKLFLTEIDPLRRFAVGIVRAFIHSALKLEGVTVKCPLIALDIAVIFIEEFLYLLNDFRRGVIGENDVQGRSERVFA